MVQQQIATKAPSRNTRVAYSIVAAFGVPTAIVAWVWYGFAQDEAQSEQGKALSAGTTMAGFGEIFGGVPVVLAHIIGLVTLLLLGWYGYRGRGIPLAILTVFVTSLIGIGVAQLLWEGELFLLGINNRSKFVP